MSPAPFRHTLIWSLPTLAVLLTFLWYKKRRGSLRSDPGGRDKGTRKAKKQEEASELDSSLPYNNCKVQVSEIDSATSREEAQSIKYLPVIEKDIVGLSFAEKQENEDQMKVNQNLTVKPSLSLYSNHSPYTNNNCFKGESFVKFDEKNSFGTKLEKVKENLHSTSSHNCASTHTEEKISCDTNFEVAVSPKTTLQTSVSQGTVSSSTNFDRTCSTDTNSDTTVPSKVKSHILILPEVTVAAVVTLNNTCENSVSLDIASESVQSQVTNTQALPLQEISTQVTVCREEDIYKVNSEIHVSNEVNIENKVDSEIHFLNSEDPVSSEVNSEISSSSEVSSQICVSSEESSEICASSEVSSEAGVSSEVIFEASVSGEAISEAAVSKEVDKGSRTLFTDTNCVYDSNSLHSVNEEKIPIIEFCSVEDSSSATKSIACDNSSECHSEDERVPESVADTCKLKTNSNSDLVTKTEREEMKPIKVEVNESSLREESDAAETNNMHSKVVEESLGEGDVAAANGDCNLEGKLAALDLGKTRDSANHSPAEVMLASPSASSYSDEGSSDSGKGCSDLATPPSRTPASGSSVSGDATALSVYEFVIPQHLVGRLIGRHGAFVHQIKAKTNASILIKRHPDTPKLKICAVEGTQLDIDSALEMIRKKFPLKHYPSVTLEQVCFVPPVPVYPIFSECLQLMLVEGVSNDVILSSLVTPCHFFLQQPTHPTYPALSRLNVFMNHCYSEPNVPLLPTPISSGVICAAPTMGGWFRAQVVSVDNGNSTCEVKFVDYGGYLSLEHSALRQIRSDFMTLPFQASECFLANVVPAGGEEASWSPEAAAAVEELTRGQVLQAQVCDYSEENIPNIFLYAVHCNQVVLVNQELVSRGYAEWLTVEEINDASSS